MNGLGLGGKAKADATAALDEKLLAISYARASWDRNRNASSVTTQRRELEIGIENAGMEHVEHFFDNDVSASKLNVRRTEFERMLSRLEGGHLNTEYLVVYDISRLFRNRRDKLRIETLISKGLKLLDLRWGINTGEKSGMLMFGIIAEIAIERAEELSQYVKAANRRRQAEGQFVQYSNPPFGFKLREDGTQGFAIEEAEARCIRWAAKELLLGASHRSIIRAWNDERGDYYTPTRTGGKWLDGSFRSVMTSPRIAGYVELPLDDGTGGVELVRNTDGRLPSIISIEDLRKLQAHYEANRLEVSGGSARGRGRVHLLSGFARCSRCDAPLYGRRTKQKGRRYICRECGSVTICADFLDDYLKGAVLARLESGAVSEALASATEAEGVSELAQELERHEAELRQVDGLAERGEISAPRYAKFSSGHERQILILKERLATLLREASGSSLAMLPRDIAERASEYWEEADIEWRRSVTELCFDRLILHPAPKGRLSLEDRVARIELVPRGTLTAPVPETM